MKLQVSGFHQRFTHNIETIQAPASTVKELLDFLKEKFPLYHEKIFVDGKIPRFLCCFKNEEDIRFLQGVDTPLEENDTVTIMNAFAGG